MTKASASASAMSRVRAKRVPTQQEIDALDRATKFMKSLPDFIESCFCKALERTHLVTRSTFPIPKHFQETITRPNEETVTQQNEETVTQKDEETVTYEEIVTLKDEEGGKYIVKYKYKPKSFQGGWSGFVKNHDLRVGDAVVFNQIDKFVFDVYMFRARDKSENVVCQHQCKSKCAADKASTSTSFTEARESICPEAMSLRTELEELKQKLLEMAQDRDRLLLQVHSLSYAVKYNGESSLQESNNLLIKTLERDLADVRGKLQVSSKKNMEVQSELESRNKLVDTLKEELVEAEKLRIKLQNMILELKGNIRVFCRVRPPVHDDGKQIKISYPKSVEEKGHAIHLSKNGMPSSIFFFSQITIS